LLHQTLLHHVVGNESANFHVLFMYSHTIVFFSVAKLQIPRIPTVSIALSLRN